MPKFVKMGFCDTKTNFENLKKKQFLPLIAVPNKFKLGNYTGPKIEFSPKNFGAKFWDLVLPSGKIDKTRVVPGTIFGKIISNTVRIWYVPTGRPCIIRGFWYLDCFSVKEVQT